MAEYLVDLNATQAAIRAGYSARTAHAQGPRLLENVEVRRIVDETLERRAARVEVKTDDILRELLRLAMVDIGEAFDDKNRLKPLNEMSPDVRRAIAGVEVSQEFEGHGKERYHSGDLLKVKFWDKARALELLGKHLKLFVDKVELSADSSFADVLKAARERAQRG